MNNQAPAPEDPAVVPPPDPPLTPPPPSTDGVQTTIEQPNPLPSTDEIQPHDVVQVIDQEHRKDGRR